jgi:hypothetical protein
VIKTQEELDQLEAVDYLREAQAGEPSFCREFRLSDAPETRMNRGGTFLNIYKRDHFVECIGGFCLGNVVSCGDIYYSFTSREELASQVLKLPLPASSAAATRRVSNLPYNSLGPLFKGRVATLVELKERFRTTDCQAIHGLGGVGKTRLAIEYAWRHAGDYSALLSVSARSPADFRSNLAALCNAEILNLSERDRPEETERLAAVFRWLSENPGWLLILDNADTIQAAAEVEKTLPKLQSGDMIITSRIADWSLAVQPVELDVLALLPRSC